MSLASANSELVSAKLHFFDNTPEEFDKFVTNNLGWPKFRGQQIREWVYQRLVTDPQQMTNLAKLDR